MKTEHFVDKQVQIYGEKFRKLIEDSIDWLNANESKWELDLPIDKPAFIKDLIERSRQ